MSDDALFKDMFFRLRAFNDKIPPQERQILESSQLYFAHPKDLNDPFECKPHIRWSRDARFSKKEIRDLNWTQYARSLALIGSSR